MRCLVIYMMMLVAFCSKVVAVSVLYEDFSGVTIGSLSNVKIGGYDLNDFNVQRGWITDESICFASGYCVLYPFDKGVLTTPELNLDSDDGMFNVTVTCVVGKFGTFYSSDSSLAT